MFVAWIVFPVLLAALCVGCGLLAERLFGHRLPGPLLPSLGLASIIAVTFVATTLAIGATLAPWLVGLLALAGFAVGWDRLRSARVDGWAVALAAVTFAWLAAPVLLSGEATFLGYFVLNDSIAQFVLVDWVADQGRTTPATVSSAYEVIAHAYLTTGYPLGSHMPLVIGQSIVGEDVAWLFHPYLAFVLTLAALALYSLAYAVRPAALRALAAFVVIASGLVYSYYVAQSSIKELVMLWALIAAVGTVTATLRHLPSPTALVPPVIMLAAGFFVLSLAAVPWLGLSAAALCAVVFWRLRHAGWRAARPQLAFLGGAAALVLLTSLDTIREFVSVQATSLATDEVVLGNLPAPLSRWQMLGIWPEDFRLPLAEGAQVPYALMGIAFAGFVVGALWAVRGRLWGPALLLASAALASVFLVPRGSPWADAKVYMIASGAVVFTAMLGAASLHRSGRQIEGWLLGLVLLGGVVWTNAVMLKWVQPAPRAVYEELAAVSTDIADHGPTLFTDSDEFVAHFAGDAQPQVHFYLVGLGGGPELVADAPAKALQEQGARIPTYDIDELATDYVQRHPLIVRRRSPVASRPPANYERTWVGTYYEVWQRDDANEVEVLERHPAGDGVQPATTIPCRALRALGTRAKRAGAQLAYVERPELPALIPAELPDHGGQWGPPHDPVRDPFAVTPFVDDAELVGEVMVDDGGDHVAWMQGVFGRGFSVSIEGDDIGAVEGQFTPGQFSRVGEARVGPGGAQVTIRRHDDALRPGQRDQEVGPLVLQPEDDDQEVRFVSPARAEELCGRRLDWVEIVRPADGPS